MILNKMFYLSIILTGLYLSTKLILAIQDVPSVTGTKDELICIQCKGEELDMPQILTSEGAKNKALYLFCRDKPDKITTTCNCERGQKCFTASDQDDDGNVDRIERGCGEPDDSNPDIDESHSNNERGAYPVEPIEESSEWTTITYCDHSDKCNNNPIN